MDAFRRASCGLQDTEEESRESEREVDGEKGGGLREGFCLVHCFFL